MHLALAEDAVKTTTNRLKEVKEEAKTKLETFADLLSEKEYNYIKSTINNCNVPTIKLLVKDHKSKDEAGEYPTRLVVSAKNFTAAFPHTGQRGIKRILDKNNINYSRKTITQATHLKEQLEILPIRKSTNTIMSIDAEKMYPSVKFEQIKRAVDYFLQDVPNDEKEIAKRCLDMVKYGMDNCFVTYEDQYWIYGGSLPVEEKGLTIGGFESAFFADLVAAYIPANAKDVFSDTLFNKIYRDDGIDIKHNSIY